MSQEYSFHQPVMLAEVLSFLPKKKKITYLDMTLGRAGHASAILEKLSIGSTFYGVDRDCEALSYSKKRLEVYEKNISLNYLHSTFSDAIPKLKKQGVTGVDFLLMDIGVSSPQFDDPKRGFSYRFDAPLDMRMNQQDSLTAKEIINTYSKEELIRVFRDLGECKDYYHVVEKILTVRQEKEISTTFELVDLIKENVSYQTLKKEGHPAKQFFLGLRYEVNGEIAQLKKGLQEAISFLNSKGRLVIITFNSEEDKIVKDLFKSVTSSAHKDKYKTKDVEDYTLLTKKPLLPTQQEIEENHRAKPSILRALERN